MVPSAIVRIAYISHPKEELWRMEKLGRVVGWSHDLWLGSDYIITRSPDLWPGRVM